MNILHHKLDLKNVFIVISVDLKNEAKKMTEFSFSENEVPSTIKILTNNMELDSRKVIISRPAIVRINLEQVKQNLLSFGNIEEFYEIISNPRKRSFVVHSQLSMEISIF